MGSLVPTLQRGNKKRLFFRVGLVVVQKSMEDNRFFCLAHLKNQNVTAHMYAEMVFQNVAEGFVVVRVREDFAHFLFKPPL